MNKRRGKKARKRERERRKGREKRAAINTICFINLLIITSIKMPMCKKFFLNASKICLFILITINSCFEHTDSWNIFL
jgi:hypothetical protein